MVSWSNYPEDLKLLLQELQRVDIEGKPDPRSFAEMVNGPNPTPFKYNWSISQLRTKANWCRTHGYLPKKSTATDTRRNCGIGGGISTSTFDPLKLNGDIDKDIDDDVKTDDDDDDDDDDLGHAREKRFSSLGRKTVVEDEEEIPFTVEGDNILYEYVEDSTSDTASFCFPKVVGNPNLTDTNGKVVFRSISNQIDFGPEKEDTKTEFYVTQTWNDFEGESVYPKEVKETFNAPIKRLRKVSTQRGWMKRRNKTTFRPHHEMKDGFTISSSNGLVFVKFAYKSKFSETPQKPQTTYEF